MVKGNVVPTKTSPGQTKSFGTKFGFKITNTPPTELHPPAVVKGTAVPLTSSESSATPSKTPEWTGKNSFGPSFAIPTGAMVGSGASLPTASPITLPEATVKKSFGPPAETEPVVPSKSSQATETPSKVPETTGKKSFGTKFGFDAGAKTER
jgi:hypothetical protein